MSSKNKKVQASAAAAADEHHHHQDSIVPASSDSTSTTAAGSSFTASSSIPSTNPSTTTTTNEADNIDNEPSASSVAISSLKETGQQLLKDALKVEPQQLMNSLKEQGQAAYMQLSLPPNLNPFGSVIGGGGDGDEVVAAKGEDHSIIEKGVAAESNKKLATTNTTSSARSTKSFQKSASQPTESKSKSGSAVQDYSPSNSKINVSSPDKKSKDKGSSGDIKDSDNDTDSLVDETDLKQAYPLLLQRSASSAFGSPDKSSKGRKMRARRAHSNSGSDPGAINSAFHPVWSKSLSTGSSHGSISGSNIDGSEVGSAVSSSIAASTIRSAHSDPFPSIQFGAASDNTNSPSKKRSPWKKLFKNRMKNREKWASFSKREQSLSGRENPARPDLIRDEDEGAYMSVTVLEGASEEPASPVKASSAQKKKKKKGKRGSSSTSSGSKKSAATKKQGNVSQAAKDEKQYDDPPVALDMSDSDEENDDAFEPIGDYSLNERPQSIVPPSQLGNRPEKKQAETPLSFDVPCDSVEVISTSVTPTPFGQSSSQSTNIQVVSPNSIEENSPPTVERVTVVIEEAPYHPLGGNEEKASGPSEAVETAVSQYDETSNVAAKLKYRSPKRSSSRASSSGGSSIQHQSNSHQHSPSSMGQVSTDTSRLSSEGSPSSRISSSNSRFSGVSSGVTSGGDRTINTLQSGEGSLVVDSTNYEIREANRRSGIRVRTLGGDSHEVMSGHDGNDTVFSSSTTSSNYHTSSPRKLRDGATMPVDRFFAGGNVAMSPSPSPQRYTMSSAASSGDGSSRASPGISRFLSSPKTLTRIGASGMSNSTSSSKDTNSPQTVSSNSVANSSSSGSETKKPLQFVAYETVREEGESPFDEEPLDSKDGGADERETSPSNTKSSLIKPRISKVVRTPRHRPPLGSPQKPPQSPRVKPNSLSYGRARTPTRTPPPSSYREIGGASTPCSPPAIIDNLALGDLNLKTTKPLVLRRSSSVPQSSSGEPMLLINPGSPGQRESPWPHRRAQHQVPPRPPQTNRLRTEMTVVGEEEGAQEVTMVSPTSSSQLQTKSDMNDANDKGDSTIAVVSPEKGF